MTLNQNINPSINIHANAGHTPVLLNEVVQLLNPAQGGAFVDGTFGGGGHSRALLAAGEGVQLLGIDRDPAAAPRADAFKQAFEDRFAFKAANFGELSAQDLRSSAPFAKAGYTGALLDIGVSSFQLDEGARGFSFREDAALDMRMDPSSGQSAADFLKTAPEADLMVAVRDLGEERAWRRVVNAIVTARAANPAALETTKGFAALVDSAVPRLKQRPGMRAKKMHAATLTFQGVRMFVNGELEALSAALEQFFEALVPGGVLVVISFHSLEDRIVKRTFKELCGMPVHRGDARTANQRPAARGKLLTRRAVVPTAEEVSANPRCRSSKLRAVQKL